MVCQRSALPPFIQYNLVGNSVSFSANVSWKVVLSVEFLSSPVAAALRPRLFLPRLPDLRGNKRGHVVSSGAF